MPASGLFTAANAKLALFTENKKQGKSYLLYKKLSPML